MLSLNEMTQSARAINEIVRARVEARPRRGAIGKALIVYLATGSIGAAIVAYLVFGSMNC